MTLGDDKTIGEIARSVDRIESDLLRLTGQMQVAIAPISAHAVLIASNQATLDRINTHLESTDARVELIQNRSAYIAGLITGVGALVNFIFGRHG